MEEKQGFIGLKKVRERLGLKQRELADILCISPSNYHHWESGRYEVPFSALQKLFEMGATVEELFGVAYSPGNYSAMLKQPLSAAEAGAIVKQGLGFLYGNVGETIQIGVRNG